MAETLNVKPRCAVRKKWKRVEKIDSIGLTSEALDFRVVSSINLRNRVENSRDS